MAFYGCIQEQKVPIQKNLIICRLSHDTEFQSAKQTTILLKTKIEICLSAYLKHTCLLAEHK